MTRTPPHGWAYRQMIAHSEESYQMVCGHYQKKGIYACKDCNLAPLSDLLAVRDALVATIEVLESCLEVSPTPRANLDALAINAARAILEQVDA